MATKQNFERCHTWSQLKAQQSLLLNSTFSATSWNYIFSQQDGFGVVNGFVGGCLEKNKSPKVCSHKCKSKLPKIQSVECRFFSHMLLPTSWATKWYQWLRIWLSRNIRFVSVNMSMSARNRHFHASYWCTTRFRRDSAGERPLLESVICVHMGGSRGGGVFLFVQNPRKGGVFQTWVWAWFTLLAGRE